MVKFKCTKCDKPYFFEELTVYIADNEHTDYCCPECNSLIICDNSDKLKSKSAIKLLVGKRY